MAQLATITSHSGRSRNFRWPYQAKVINTFEPISSRMGASLGGMLNMRVLLVREARLYHRALRLNDDAARHRPRHAGGARKRDRQAPGGAGGQIGEGFRLD